jgi:hypothetical protein
MTPIAEFDQLDNPYQSTSHGLQEFVADAPLIEYVGVLRAFVGARADYYLRKWAPRLQDPSGETGMNWAAFFLTALWLAYRKMYKAALILYGVMILLWFVQVGIFMFGLGMPNVPPAVSLLVNVMVCVTCGACGNSWYLAHANRAIAAARKQGLDGNELLATTARRGGTNMAAALGIVFAPLVVLLFLGLALAFVLAIFAHAP